MVRPVTRIGIGAGAAATANRDEAVEPDRRPGRELINL